MDIEDLSYRAEYAKSGRAGCRGCKSPIAKDTLRLAVMVQSPMFDGKQPQWYHFMCFFNKQRPKSVDDIGHFDSLRWEDQEKIKEKISNASTVILPTKKGKKRDAAETKAKKAALKDFIIEYSKSSRATCRGCEQKIMKEEIRISKKDFDTEVGRKYGGQDMWHHVSCFAKLRSELCYYESAEALPGFKSLKKEDQKEVKTQLPAIKQEDVPEIKKQKIEDEVDSSSLSEEEKKIQEQNKIMFKYRDQLKKSLKKKDLILLLEANDQEIPVGEEKILDRLSDIMTFGALKPCKVCKGGQYVFNKLGYICQGDVTEWTKCGNVTKEPSRSKFVVPPELAADFSFLAKYKYVPRTRIFRKATSVKKEENSGESSESQPKVIREKPALYNMEFVILGKTAKGKDVLKKEIVKLGGKVTTKIHRSVMAVISTLAEVEKMGSRISEAETENVHIVSEDFVDEAPNHVGKIPDLVVAKSICNWGSDPNTRLPAESSMSKSKSKSLYMSSKPSKVKLKLKGGGAVDPDSGLENSAHVYQDDSGKYTSVLGLTDIQKGKNSYYKIQLLAADKGNKYWVFRAWGRIGTTIGSNKLEDMTSLHEAKKHFCALYEEKSGNLWEDRDSFVKVPGRMYPVDVEYDNEENIKMEVSDEPSKLPVPVQDLIKMIFDVNSMKKVMLEFELDTEKMPLGKLSKKQIQSAFSVLSEIQELIKKNNGQMPKLIDASNRFYTFIPHSFGIDNPPIIQEEEVVKQKLDMLDNLMELEIAYNLMKSTGSDNSVDNYYAQLKADLDVLDKNTEEFKLLQEYVKNTHAATHSSYELEIIDVFTVKRQGEEKRYKPFRKLHNRKLLWHGSRKTNFAGILSQGLRIAPPEAPVTGYMFGKGIYFADMVSKSANYCCTTPSNNTGLLLLCEVALGDMLECKNAKYIEKLPKGKHSTLGLGMTQPDPTKTKVLNGVDIPLGSGVPVNNIKSSLLYNEYIVYDVAQVNQKYLLKVNFKYKY